MPESRNDPAAALPGDTFSFEERRFVDSLADRGDKAPTIVKKLAGTEWRSAMTERTIRNRITARRERGLLGNMGDPEDGRAADPGIEGIVPPPSRARTEETETDADAVILDAVMEGSAVLLRVTNPGPADSFQILVEVLDAEVLRAQPVNPFHARWGYIDYLGSEPLEPRDRRHELVQGDAEFAMIAMLDPIESLLYPTREMRQQSSLQGTTIVRLYSVEDTSESFQGFVEQAVAVPAEIHLRISVLGQSRRPVTERFVLKLGERPWDGTFTKAQ